MEACAGRANHGVLAGRPTCESDRDEGITRLVKHKTRLDQAGRVSGTEPGNSDRWHDCFPRKFDSLQARFWQRSCCALNRSAFRHLEDRWTGTTRFPG
jgi:hypothetical protein